MSKLTLKAGLTCLLLGAGLAQAADVPEEVIQQSFFPYKNWKPEFAGFTPGTKITQANADQFQPILDEAVYFFVKNGWVEIDTDVTTEFPLSANYIAASRKNGDVQITESGTLTNY